MAKHPKRQYSRAFTPHGDGQTLTIKRIPASIMNGARARAKRDGRSIRALVLAHLAEYAGIDVPAESAEDGGK